MKTRVALLIAVIALWVTLLLMLPVHAAHVDKDCNYTQGTTSTQTGFDGCDVELTELYRIAPRTATGVSGTNAISLIFDPVLGTPAAGSNVIFTAVATSTNTVTIIIDGGAPANAANESGTNLGAGDITNGQTYLATFDGTKWRVIVRGSGGGGGAPTTASYVLMSANGSLSAERILTAGTGLGLTDGGAEGNATLAINDVELTSILGLTSAADSLPYYTGSGTAALTTFTGFARTLVDDANAAAAWATLTGDELAQDAVGGILTDGTFIDFTYTDGGPTIAATIIAGSLTATELGADSVGSSELNIGDAEAEIEGAVDTLASLTSIQGFTVTLADAGTNVALGWDDTAGAYENLTAAEVAAIVAGQEGALEAVLDLADLQGDLPLSTKTSGNYVGTVSAGTGIAITGADAENATKGIAFDYSDAGADPALGADECRFTNDDTTPGYIVCEGGTANASESRIAFTNPTGERVMTIPDANSNPVQPQTCSGTDKVAAISSTGVVTCATDEGGAGSGDNITVEDSDNAGTFTAAGDAQFEDQGDIDFVLDTGTTPDNITALVRPDSVALTTDTTGNYAAGDAEAGAALTGDTATGFFSAGTLEDARITGSDEADEVLNSDKGDFTCTTGTCDLDADVVTPTELAEAGNYDFTGTVVLDSDALQLDDTNASHQLILTPGSDLTLDRVLTITTGDAARTLTLTDDVSLGDADKGDITVGTDFTDFQIDADTITTSELADNAVAQANVADNAIGNAEMADNAIQTAELADNAVTQAEVGDDAIGINELDLVDGDTPVNGDCLTYDTGAGGSIEAITCPGAGAGDNVTINTTAVTDPDFDNATPAAPAGGYNVKWQTASNDVSAYVDFTGATDLTAVANADTILINDVSATNTVKETTVAELIEGVIESATEDTAPNHADDFLIFYDTSAGTVDKVNPEKIGIGKKPIALLAGAGTVPVSGAIAACTMTTAAAPFDSGTNDIFMKNCSFSASTDNALYWTIPAPKSSDETIDWTVRIDWTSTTTTDASDDVIWTASAVCFSNDDAINGNAFPAVDTVTDTQTAAGDFLSSGEITAITPAGTWAENDMCVLRVTRDADAAGDNFNGTAELINAQLFITTNANTDN